jgi:acetylornithine deacetylase/succinyl-diaminopimelate desuccinylase-like protein
MIFANLWCFGGILDGVCRKSGGELNALIRTTVAFTQMDGSKAPNVIPPEASMVSNIRLNPEDSVESAKQYIKTPSATTACRWTCWYPPSPAPYPARTAKAGKRWSPPSGAPGAARW